MIYILSSFVQSGKFWSYYFIKCCTKQCQLDVLSYVGKLVTVLPICFFVVIRRDSRYLADKIRPNPATNCVPLERLSEQNVDYRLPSRVNRRTSYEASNTLRSSLHSPHFTRPPSETSLTWRTDNRDRKNLPHGQGNMIDQSQARTGKRASAPTYNWLGPKPAD